MRIALCQIKPVLGDIEKNLKKIKNFIEKSMQNNSDLSIFPELAISGNNLLEKTKELALTFSDPMIKELETIKTTQVIVGLPIKMENAVFNGALFIADNTIKSFQAKINLSKNVFYNERELYSVAESFNTFDINGKKALILIGDDIFDFDNISKMNEVENIFHIHNFYIGSPVLDKQLDAYKYYVNILGKRVFSVNRVGTEDGIIFSGNSAVFEGKVEEKRAKSFGAGSFDEEIIYFDI